MAVTWLMVTWGTHTGSRYQRLPVVSRPPLGNFSGSRNDDFKRSNEWMSRQRVSLVFSQAAGLSSMLMGTLWLSAANSRAW